MPVLACAGGGESARTRYVVGLKGSIVERSTIPEKCLGGEAARGVYLPIGLVRAAGATRDGRLPGFSAAAGIVFAVGVGVAFDLVLIDDPVEDGAGTEAIIESANGFRRTSPADVRYACGARWHPEPRERKSALIPLALPYAVLRHTLCLLKEAAPA
jgi:hypothetical protein